MRKLTILILFIALNLLTVSAQKEVSDKMYKFLENHEEVTYLSLSKSMLGFIEFDEETDVKAGDDKQITGDLNEVKLVIFKPNDHPQESFKSMVLKYLKKGRYNLIEDDDKGNDDTEVWVHRKGKKVYECHVIFQGEKNAVLMSFLGDFKVTDVDKLREKIVDYK